MSPASSGPLEVEKYIGACLISSRSKNPQNGQQANREMYYPRERYQRQDIYNNQGCPLNVRPRRNNNEGWTGMPLISFANNHRRNRKETDTRSSSPRVAEDATTLSRLAVHTQGVPLILSNRHGNRRNKNNPRGNIPNRQVEPTKKESNRAVDSISVASDESSGSNNSETCLPRIIKPRKRRKKDRKPHKNDQQNGPSSIVTLKPYVVPFCYRDKYTPPRFSEISENIVPLSSLSEDLSEAPKLHHNFEDIVGVDVESESQPSLCQCRYCDPSGQIWDVDRHCYSPFLTTPTFSKTSPIIAEKIRSALEHLSTFSFEPDVLVEEEQSDRCLEISTEIVTSPNGHRDLEIRLFSAKGKKDKWDTGDRTNRMAPEE